MADFRKNKKVTQLLYSRPTLILLGVVSIVFLVNVVDIAKKSLLTREEKAAAVEKEIALKKQEADLNRQIDELKTNNGVEENIREKFRVVKDGEGLILVVDDPKQENVADANEDSSGFFGFLKKIFKW